MKTVVLDDDPTGTQSAAGAWVALDTAAELIEQLLRKADGIFVQTNSRALSEKDAVELAHRIRLNALEAGRRIGEPIRFVLRGDSTLRGHVFAEIDVFDTPESVVLFVPAFPDGGRTTANGIHRVRVDGVDVPAGQTEYAADPVFPFRSSSLVEYVREKSSRVPVAISLHQLRAGGLTSVLLNADHGAVVVPDVVSNSDIYLIAQAVDKATQRGAEIIVRSAAPLAARLAGVASSGLLPVGQSGETARVLVACGSHTAGARAQLAHLDPTGRRTVEINTEMALADPEAAGHAAADSARPLLAGGLAIISSERVRLPEHNTLWHGAQVMDALGRAVEVLAPDATAVVTKGGITSARVAVQGLGASSAFVLGQALVGVPMWTIADRMDRQLPFVIVPGNVGGADTLRVVVDRLSPANAADLRARRINVGSII